MGRFIDFVLPDEYFWKKYSLLWQNSVGRSPFQAPHILKSHIDIDYSKNAVDAIACFQYFRDGELLAAALFRQKNGIYTFLSDVKTDANFFVLHSRCSQADIRQIFGELLQAVKQNNGALMLNHQPAWAGYMGIFEEVGKLRRLYWQNIPYSVCPVTKDEPPGALFERVNGFREFRYPVNRLKNQEQAIFEALTDDTDMELWVDEFCRAHIRRWADTPTPSAYGDPTRQQCLKQYLNAWNADRVLVRFSVKVPRGRVGFAIGLLEENSLIFHSTTFHPDYKKFSPGKALIHFIAEWMARQNIRVLDFGDGDEPYKYDVAEQERRLNRIFVSHRSNLSFILKAKAIKIIRDNPKMYNFYRDTIKRIIRSIKAWKS